MILWRKDLLAGGVLAVAMSAGAANAQVQTPGPFGSLTGFYGFRGGSNTELFTGGGGIGGVTPGRTLEGILHGGFRFGDFDVAVGLTGGTLSQRSTAFAGTGIATNEARFFAIDLEGGYNAAFGPVGVRPFIGVRYGNWKHTYGVPTSPGAGSPASADINTWGIGPRLGVDGAVRLSEMFSLFAGGSGSVMFGRLNESGFFTGAFAPPNQSVTRTTYNFDGKIGVAIEPIPLLSIAAGYRVEYWGGVTLTSFTTAAAGPGAGRGNRFTHGPFVRVAYNIGAPAASPVPVPPDPVVVDGKAYMVFFDFDRSTITATAATTIKQAAADAKAGRKTRIGVTGHADRSGSDAYNMALSLRRANAVKDQLVREGIPATAISVVGRGESQPLVQTADGVREPQNRRVEIVLQ
ncbi:MAG: OmpA family protein [Alphaproteobacteria bacterium]|nr:OmpA family protein [Alphaproteobacteria bacterium]MCW5741239.1 OmpA family protein [Alphaproteobacteria bacterium]